MLCDLQSNFPSVNSLDSCHVTALEGKARALTFPVVPVGAVTKGAEAACPNPHHFRGAAPHSHTAALLPELHRSPHQHSLWGLVCHAIH